MRRWLLVLPMLGCIVGAIWLARRPADAPQAVEQSDPALAVPAAMGKAAHESAEARRRGSRQDHFTPVTGGPPQPIVGIDPFPGVPKSRIGLPMGSDPFTAQSREEQQWLDRNGYPNEQQWQAYTVAADVTLEAAAAHGDSIAAVMLAARQFAHGDPQASGKLLTAGAHGSGFALSMLASHLDTSKQFGNPELGYAISRLAELRGDWRIGFVREGMFAHALSSEQKTRANAKALEMLAEFSKRNPAWSQPDPRPWPPTGKP